MVLIKYILANLSVKEKVELFKRLYEEVAGMGINGDTELAHINKHEGAILKMMGGSGTINEETGLMQYFGGSPPPPPAASSTVTQQQTIPDEMKPYITDVLTQSQALNKQRAEEGYQPYQGAQIAEFQPEQQQAQTGIAGLVGSGQPYFDKAEALTQQAGQAPTAEIMQSYMSPYMQNVVDIQKREALRQGDVAAQAQAAGAVNVGAYGGSRDAIVQAEQQRNLATQLGDIQAKGSAAAYADAQQQYAAQQKNALAAGAQFGALATGVPGQAMKEFGALESVGAAKQQQEQQALNIAKQQFIQEQTFPEANLQQYSSIIRGYNLPPNTYQTAQTVTPAPSYMQQIAGLGMAGAGIAGAFSGFKGAKEGGLVGLARGGKVLRRQEGGLATREPIDIEGADIPADGGGLSQVNILASMDTPSLLQAKDNPRFSRTLVEQELTKREPSVREQLKTNIGVSKGTSLPRTGMVTNEPVGQGFKNLGAGISELLEPKDQPRRTLFSDLSGVINKGAEQRSEDQKNTLVPKLSSTRATAADRFTPVYANESGVIDDEAKQNALESLLGAASKDVKGTNEETAAIKGSVTEPKKAPQILLNTPEKGQEDVPLLKDKGNAITSQYKNVPMDALKQLTEKKDALVGQTPQAEGLANDIYSDAISKLQASTDKKKNAMSDRAAGLDQAKWLAVADMGFQMMAAPGGATLIQALGGAAGKSGIAGKLASLNDKQKEMAFNLAEMDEKQIMNTFGISQAQASQANEQAKLGLMARELDIKIIHEENVEKKAQLQALKDRIELGIKLRDAQSNEIKAGAAMLSAENKEPRAIPQVSEASSKAIGNMYDKLWANAQESSTIVKSTLGVGGTKDNYRDAFILEVNKRISKGEDASTAADAVFKKLTSTGGK